MTVFARHDLLLLDAAAREYARKSAIPLHLTLPDALIDAVIFSDVPAIVRRQEDAAPGFAQVGFSSHLRREGIRVRISATVPADGVRGRITPFDAMAMWNQGGAPKMLMRLADERGIDVGLYGSAALEAVTGLPYLTSDSDIDVLVRPQGDTDLRAFYEAAITLGKAHNVRFDMEALCTDGAGVKLAELFSGQKTVLCKALHTVELRPITCATLPI
ncbi:MAG: malonate decarboxylase holo-[acyl-carrier-protein] synthase [Oscillospiraceae bacterium]|nr:malonate decarboxylase holo-[acyl-carrier-protein] synthase [Oscillospiraceae bacterium]